MSYRSSSKRRRYSRARTYRRKWSGGRVPSASRKKLRAVANLRTGGLLGIEKKFFDTKFNTGSATVPPSPAPPKLGHALKDSPLPMDAVNGTAGGAGVTSCYYLNCPAVGSASYQRDGRVIRNHTIEIQGRIDFAMANEQYGYLPTACIALVLDTQCNGVTPASKGDNVYQDIGGGLTVPMRVMSDTTRYRVLAFKRVIARSVGLTKGVGGDSSFNGLFSANFKMFRKLGFKTNFKTDKQIAGPDAIVDNGIFIMAWENDATSDNLTLTLSCRLRFTG